MNNAFGRGLAACLACFCIGYAANVLAAIPLLDGRSGVPTLAPMIAEVTPAW